MQMKTAITMDEGVAMPHPIYKYWLFFSFCFRLMTKTKIKNVKINFGKKGRNLFVCWFLRLMAEKMIANRFDCVTHTSSLEDLSSRWPLGVEACAKKKKIRLEKWSSALPQCKWRHTWESRSGKTVLERDPGVPMWCCPDEDDGSIRWASECRSSRFYYANGPTRTKSIHLRRNYFSGHQQQNELKKIPPSQFEKKEKQNKTTES